MNERRIYEREQVNIPFIYSLDEGESLHDGEWNEATTVDIGPVLVGGLAFFTDQAIEVGQPVRIALFMDLNLKQAWEQDEVGFPVIYNGTVCRVQDTEQGRRVAVSFEDMDHINLAEIAPQNPPTL